MIADNNLKITTINIQKIQKITLFYFQPAVCAHPNISFTSVHRDWLLVWPVSRLHP